MSALTERQRVVVLFLAQVGEHTITDIAEKSPLYRKMDSFGEGIKGVASFRVKGTRSQRFVWTEAIVRALERKGLVDRSPIDGNFTFDLTGMGREVAKGLVR